MTSRNSKIRPLCPPIVSTPSRPAVKMVVITVPPVPTRLVASRPTPKTPPVASRPTPKTPPVMSRKSNDLWYKTPTNQRSREIKIIGITPLGEISRVPTIEKEQFGTSRNYPKTPRGYSYTPRSIHTSSPLDSSFLEKGKLQPLPNISGKVSLEIFNKALLVYENNQVFYQVILEKQGASVQLRSDLTHLEHWFMCIIEPPSPDSQRRESMKITQGVSGYCDPLLYQYIAPLPNHLKEFIQANS